MTVQNTLDKAGSREGGKGGGSRGRERVLGSVRFTKAQCDYLQKVFPEVLCSASTAESEIRHRLGQRSVVIHILERVQE